ncbi:MAG: right-handed parallel beta-helix repeat-containing protein, partial [Dehalococcoidia bacterium]
MKRLLSVAILFATAVVVCSAAFRVNAAATDFQIVGLTCGTSPGVITIQNTSGGTSTLGHLAVVITPAGATSGTTIEINPQILPPIPFPGYGVPAGQTVDLQVGPGASQQPAAAVNPLTVGQKVALTTNTLLGTGATVQLVDLGNGSATIGALLTCAKPAVVRFVSPQGFDFLDIAQTIPNSTCGSDLPPGTPPTIQNPGPCLTIDNAITYAQDAETIFVEPGFYEICHPIEVNKLVRITTRGSALKGQTNFGATVAPGDSLDLDTVLHSFSGDPIFHITAIGFPSASSPGNLSNAVANNQPPNTVNANQNHAAIDGLRMGGSFKSGAAAVVLDNDAYTDVTNNWFGGEPLSNPAYTGIPCAQPQPFPPAAPNPLPVAKSEVMGNATAILLKNSDHANIYGNAILGSSNFKYAPILAVGDVQTGFGIVTAECLGQGPDSSNAATIAVNTISRNQNAAIWLCSDGGGGHLISQNTVRSNGRGVVLRAVTSSLLDANTITDDYEDGIVLYDAASNNTIQRNVIESHRTPGSAGIRIGGFGASLFPLQTAINSNTLRRNYIGIDIAGARSTTGNGNVITSEDERTSILLQVGSTGSPSVTQPLGTSFELNQIVFNGGCAATRGCAIRLDQFVTADVDATLNNFGLPSRTDVNSVLWHKPNDPSLGFISASNPNLQPVAASPTPGVGAPGAVGGGFLATPAAAGTAAAGA